MSVQNAMRRILSPGSVVLFLLFLTGILCNAGVAYSSMRIYDEEEEIFTAKP